MSEEKETATTEDRTSLASLCIWEGSEQGAEMHHFCNTGVTLAGRGSDIADSEPNHLFTRKKDVGISSFHLLGQHVTRFKTTTMCEHVSHPHRDNFLLCYYFSLAYNFVMCSERIFCTGKLFPDFAKKVTFKNGQMESKVSGHFNNLIDAFWNIMFDHFGDDDADSTHEDEEFNCAAGTPAHFRTSMANSTMKDSKGNIKSTKRSHSLKRHAVGKLQEHLPPHSFVNRCGFVMKNMHTIFDYFVNSENQDEKAGLTLANWFHSYDGVIQGGVPPSKNGIKTAQSKLPIFINLLFRTNKFGHSRFEQFATPGTKSHVFELLALTIIRHEHSFREHLLSDPKDRWNGTEVHPFLLKLDEAYFMADVTEEEQNAWHLESRNEWVMLNFNGLPINEIEHNYADVKVDARSLVQVTGEMAKMTQHNTHLLYAMQAETRGLAE